MYCEVPPHVASAALSAWTGVTVKVAQFVVPVRHALAVAFVLRLNGPTESWFATRPLASLRLWPVETEIPELPIQVTGCPASAPPVALSTSACTGHDTAAPRAT